MALTVQQGYHEGHQDIPQPLAWEPTHVDGRVQCSYSESQPQHLHILRRHQCGRQEIARGFRSPSGEAERRVTTQKCKSGQIKHRCTLFCQDKPDVLLVANGDCCFSASGLCERVDSGWRPIRRGLTTLPSFSGRVADGVLLFMPKAFTLWILRTSYIDRSTP